MTFVSDLEPKDLWQHFDSILSIPRGSKKEDKMAAYIIEVAKRNNLDYKQDKEGNIVVRKPGTPGCDNAPVTILQAHMDMVNEKNADVEHNFDTDAIVPRKDGEYLCATGTTLGSDNGMGLAMSLAVMDSTTMQHGPLEFLFTVDEETGLTGATNLADDMLEGRTLINMDTEEEGALYVGCAGGAGINLTVNLEYHPLPDGHEALQLKLHGLKGGHSGVDIHLQRGNAVKLLARALKAVAGEHAFALADLHGGNMHNAIPREAFATVAVASSGKATFEQAVQTTVAEIQAEFKPAEPTMELAIEPATDTSQVFATGTSALVLNLIEALPHGVLAMSYDIPDLVETSSNLATVKISDGKMVIHSSNRSSVDSAIRALQQRITSIGELAGVDVEELEGYPGWKPDLDSHVLKVARQVHKEVLGTDPEVKAVHAGLECGIIGEKYPGMDMVSLGPQIEFPHSPDERVRISSVASFYKLMVGILERLGKGN